MDKNLVSLALLAACGSALAADVNLYGIVDANVGSYKNGLSTTQGGAADANAVRQNSVNSGGLRTSRWGLSGSEDLGAGLKAQFNLEQGFAADSGAQAMAGTAFDRAAWVGLSSGYGALRLGRMATPYDVLRTSFNHANDYNLGVTSDVFKAAGGDYNAWLPNQLMLVSSEYGGFSAAWSYAFGENKNGAGNQGFGSTDAASMYLRYAQGPLSFGIAYQAEEQLLGLKETTYTLVGGAYDFGVAKLVASYNQTRRAGASRDKEYQLGVSAPLGAVTLYAGYAHASTQVAGVDSEKSSGYSLLATYALSRRTDLYTGYKSATEKNWAGTEVGELRQFAVGVKHGF